MDRDQRLAVIGGDRGEAMIKDLLFPGLANVLPGLREARKQAEARLNGASLVAEIVPAAAALNAPQPCPNCQGSGLSRTPRYVSRAVGRCWACEGAKVVTLSPRDKVFRALRARDAGDAAEWGFALVERDEPHRIGPMWASIERGRIDDVIAALVEYNATHA